MLVVMTTPLDGIPTGKPDATYRRLAETPYRQAVLELVNWLISRGLIYGLINHILCGASNFALKQEIVNTKVDKGEKKNDATVTTLEYCILRSWYRIFLALLNLSINSFIRVTGRPLNGRPFYYLAAQTIGKVTWLSTKYNAFNSRSGDQYVGVNLAAWIIACEAMCTGSTPVLPPNFATSSTLSVDIYHNQPYNIYVRLRDTLKDPGETEVPLLP